MKTKSNFSRRDFLKTTGLITGTPLMSVLSAMQVNNSSFANVSNKKIKIALVGTGSKDSGIWGHDLVSRYSNELTFVGLCDQNKGRVETAKNIIRANCNTYTDFSKMKEETKPKMLIVTTIDSTHHEFIIRGMEIDCF